MYRKNVRLASAIPDWKTLERISASERGELPHADMFKRIAKEQVDQGIMLAKVLADDLCVRLERQLQFSCQPHRLYVSLMSSEEFVRRYSADMLVQAELGFPEHDTVHCLWEYAFAQACINRITGGPGEAQIENEELTAMEKLIFEGVLQEAMHSHARAWRSVMPPIPQRLALTAPKLGSKESFLHIPELIVLSVELKRADTQAVYTLRWVYTADSFAALIDQWRLRQRKASSAIVLTPEAVSMVDVPVKAQLGKAIVSMADLMLLQRGDVIVLDKYIKEPVLVDVGEDARFTAQAGAYGERLAVQLLQPIEAEKTERTNEVTEGKAVAAASSAVEDERVSDTAPDLSDDEGMPATDSDDVIEDKKIPEHEEDDILANIEEDEDEEEDEEFVWDENESTDEDF